MCTSALLSASYVHAAEDNQEDICSDPSVFFCENWEARTAGTADFTSAKYKSPGWAVSRPGNASMSVTGNQGYLGTKAFQFQYQAGNNTGPGYMDLANGFPGGPYRTIYWRWMVKFSSNFVWSAVATKHDEFRLSGSIATPQLMWFGGTGAHVTLRSTPNIFQYFSSIGQSHTFPQNVNLPSTDILVDQWSCLEVKLTMNTCDTCLDGSQEGWINGVQKFSYQNIGIDTQGGRAISGPLISGYWNCTQGDDACTGGALDFHPQMYRWEDNYVGSTKRIGCPGAAPVAPAPPKNLQVR